jgi:hypothetical protein
LRIFLPHLDGQGSGTEVEELYEYDEFLWETTEVLLVSIYHWAEHELKRVLSLCNDAPPKQDINRFEYRQQFEQIDGGVNNFV